MLPATAADEQAVTQAMIKEAELLETETEVKTRELKRRRAMEQLKKESAQETHLDRVKKLNSYLKRLSEHNDMPKVGPG